MNTQVIKSGKHAVKQFGTLHDTVVSLIQLLVTIELVFSLGHIHNQMYPPFRTDEDTVVTYKYVLLQSSTLVVLCGIIFFAQQLIKNCYPVKTTMAPWMLSTISNIAFIVVSQTQRSYYNRIKMTYKNGFSFSSYILQMIN